MVHEDEVRGALLCVQNFVRSPHFTQRNFFRTLVSLCCLSLQLFVTASPTVLFLSREATWRLYLVPKWWLSFLLVNHDVDRRRANKDSQEQWYAVGGIRPSSEDSASRSGVTNSSIVEEGQVEYVPVRAPSVRVPGPSNLRVSSGKSKKRKISRSPVKGRFEIASPPLSSQQHRVVKDLVFSAALDRQQSCENSRRSKRNRRVAPVFPGGLP